MCGARTAPDARPDSEQPSLKLRRARHAVRSGMNRTWTTGHWSNNPSQANFSFAQIVQSINQKSNDGAYRENVGASYGASQWGAGTE